MLRKQSRTKGESDGAIIHDSDDDSVQVVETSVNVTNNSPSRDYSHPDDQTTQTI